MNRVRTLGFSICAVSFIAACLAGCAPRTIALPTGTGTPLSDFATLHAAVSKPCAAVRTLTAELGLSGRAGDQRVRGRALAGFEAPDAMRLEGLAPFGAPAFILVARASEATLLLPRDDRVLRDAPADHILGALTGVALAPADLQAILTGCVVPEPRAVSGTQHGADWRSIELQGEATLFLRRVAATWQPRAASRGGWRIEYADWRGAFPHSVRLVRVPSTAPDEARVDITARIDQLETNVPIDPKAFSVDVPRDAIPITIDELREAGPLRGAESRSQ